MCIQFPLLYQKPDEDRSVVATAPHVEADANNVQIQLFRSLQRSMNEIQGPKFTSEWPATTTAISEDASDELHSWIETSDLVDFVYVIEGSRPDIQITSLPDVGLELAGAGKDNTLY